jgi:hypothetical protein
MKQLCGGNSFRKYGGNSFRKYIECGKISSWKKSDAFTLDQRDDARRRVAHDGKCDVGGPRGDRPADDKSGEPAPHEVDAKANVHIGHGGTSNEDDKRRRENWKDDFALPSMDALPVASRCGLKADTGSRAAGGAAWLTPPFARESATSLNSP